MASQTRHAHPQNPTKPKQSKPPTSTSTTRALRSLTFSVALPLLFTLSTIHFFGSNTKYRALTTNQPFWFPPLWVVHTGALGSSAFMGLAAWLVWADGGFRSEPDALPLYLAHVSLSVVWDPLVLVIGAAWLGVAFCVLHLGTLVGLHVCFKRVNPFAKDLVMPCLAWMVFLTFISFRLAVV